MPDEARKGYSSDEITARVSEVLPAALAKAKSDAAELVSANMEHAPQSGPGTAVVIALTLDDGETRIIINVRPDGGCRPVHPRIEGCGNIFDDAFDRVLTAVILRATSSRDPEQT